LGASFRALLLQRRSRLERLAGSLEALSPLAILERGYALVFDASGKLIKDAETVNPGDEISARLAKGEIAAVVKEKRT
jgi:exodeoxyribonuclease VII large subunit